MISFAHWHTEPALIGGILVFVWLYFVLIGPLRERFAPLELFPYKHAAWFIAGVVSFYLAVGSPLDAMGENYLFSAHMVQHNILMYVTAVFTIWAIPPWLFDKIVSHRKWRLVSVRILFHPVTAGFVFTGVFVGWHAPILYEAALHDKVIHMIEHLTMYGASVMMLWPILSRSQTVPALPWGMHILYLFLLMVAQIPLFAVLTFSPEVLYPTYELAPRVIPWLDPLQDQVLGGLIMKVANMVLSLLLMGYAFLQWNAAQEARREHERLRAWKDPRLRSAG